MSSRSRHLSTLDHADIERRFRRAVNMSAGELRRWLAKPESREVGFTYPGQRESVGHGSGRKIIRFLEHGLRTEADYLWARKVAGYVARHIAQRPAGDVTHTPWRYSLMNWGHDPLKGIRR